MLLLCAGIIKKATKPVTVISNLKGLLVFTSLSLSQPHPPHTKFFEKDLKNLFITIIFKLNICNYNKTSWGGINKKKQ